MKQYKSIYLPAKGEHADTEEMARIVNIWTEDGAVLHSVIPRIYEGATEGYIILLDITDVD